MRLRHELTDNFIALLSSSVLERGILAVSVMIIARMVGPVGLGPYAASFALTRILAVAFSLGLDTWLLRNGNREHDQDRLTLHTTTCLGIKASLGFLWLIAMMALTTVLDPSTFPPLFILLCSLTIYFEEIANTVWSASRAALQNQRILKLIIPGQLVLLSSIVALAIIGADKAQTYLLWQTLISAAIAIVAIVWQAHAFGYRLDRSLFAPTLRGTMVFGLSMGLAMIYGRADVALVAYYLGSEAAGLYAPAISITNALVLIPFALHMVMVPALSHEHAVHSRSLYTLSRRLLFVSAPLGIAAGVMLAFGAEWIVLLVFGSAYSETGEVLQTLSGVLTARFITLAAASILVAVGWQRHRVKPQIVIAALNVGLNILLIPRLGLMGAAGVFVFTEWVLVVSYLGLVWYWRRVNHYSMAQVQS